MTNKTKKFMGQVTIAAVATAVAVTAVPTNSGAEEIETITPELEVTPTSEVTPTEQPSTTEGETETPVTPSTEGETETPVAPPTTEGETETPVAPPTTEGETETPTEQLPTNESEASYDNSNSTPIDLESLSYSREEGTAKQQDVLANDADNEFVEHLFENVEVNAVQTKEDLSNLLIESLKNNEAAVVIKDENNVLGDLVIGGKNIVEEIEKVGSNAGALASGYSLAQKKDSKGNSTWMFIPLYEETEALASAKTQFVDQVTEFVGTNYSSDIERLNAIYSYLAQTTVYNIDTQIVSSSPASLVLENEAVCEAFAYVYAEIANKLGINTKYVTGIVERDGEQIGHAWNLVEVDNQWYNSDATWGNIDRNNKDGLEVNMSYFLFSDEIAKLNYKRDHDTLPEATDTKFDVLHNEENYAFGGGVTGELIVSPKSKEVVVYNYETDSVASIPMETAEYQILNTALVGESLYVKVVSKHDLSTKIQKLNIKTGELENLEFEALSQVGVYDEINFADDGIYAAGILIAKYDSNAKVISKDLTVDIELKGENQFAIEAAYSEFLKQKNGETETPVVPPTEGETETPVTPPTEGETETPVTPPIEGETETPVTPPTEGETETPVTPPTEGETETPVTPPTEGETETPVTPPTEGETVKPVTPPTTEGETVKPVTPPTTEGETVKPVTPPTTEGETVKPVTPPTTEGETVKPVTPPTTEGGTVKPVTPPTTENVNVYPPVHNWDYTPTQPTPPIKGEVIEVETGVVTTNPGLEGVTIELPSSLIGTAAVALDLNKKGNIVITTEALNNTTAATITIPMKADKEGKVLKIVTANGLESIAYTVKDGLITIQANKAGELVFVDSDATVSDIKKSQYKTSIEKLLARGIFTGDNGRFNPKNNMTRAQFAGTLSRALGLNEVKPENLKGIPASAWYAGHAGALADLGIMGVNGKNFNPNKAITREEMFSAVGALLNLKGVNATIDIDGKFVDADKVDADSKNAIAVLVEIGAVIGDNGKLNPKDPITKGQMAKVLEKVLTHLELL